MVWEWRTRYFLGVAHTVLFGCGAHGIRWVWRTRYFLGVAHTVFSCEWRTRYFLGAAHTIFFLGPMGPGTSMGPKFMGNDACNPSGWPINSDPHDNHGTAQIHYVWIFGPFLYFLNSPRVLPHCGACTNSCSPPGTSKIDRS